MPSSGDFFIIAVIDNESPSDRSDFSSTVVSFIWIMIIYMNHVTDSIDHLSQKHKHTLTKLKPKHLPFFNSNTIHDDRVCYLDFLLDCGGRADGWAFDGCFVCYLARRADDAVTSHLTKITQLLLLLQITFYFHNPQITLTGMKIESEIGVLTRLLSDTTADGCTGGSSTSLGAWQIQVQYHIRQHAFSCIP